MGLTEKEIKKIGKEFKIPEEDIIFFLKEEERLLRLEEKKANFINSEPNKEKEAILEWQKECRNFSEFEEIYILTTEKNLAPNFFINWLKACQDYRERREVQSCAKDHDMGKAILKLWLDEADNSEEIREIISHFDKNSQEYQDGISKITKMLMTNY